MDAPDPTFSAPLRDNGGAEWWLAPPERRVRALPLLARALPSDVSGEATRCGRVDRPVSRLAMRRARVPRHAAPSARASCFQAPRSDVAFDAFQRKPGAHL